MPLWSLVSRVPWTRVLRYAPEILDGAERLMDAVRASRAARVDPGTVVPVEADLAERLAALEREQAAQAELLSTLAEQQASLTEALRLLSRRATAARWIATAALVAAAVLLLVQLW